MTNTRIKWRDAVALQGRVRKKRHRKVLHMKKPLALMIAAALAATVVPLADPARAHDHWAVIPDEAAVPPLSRAGWSPYRCSDGPVYNFYHGALYHEPPALYRGYAYRPYYRYTAYRVIPRTYLCSATPDG